MPPDKGVQSMDAISMLDGSVQSQGVKVGARDWLDMGSENWGKTPDEVKSAAFQAALVTGWTEAGLKKLMMDAWGPRVDDDAADFILTLLRELAEKHPLKVEQVYEVDAAPPKMKLHGSDEYITLPKD